MSGMVNEVSATLVARMTFRKPYVIAIASNATRQRKISLFIADRRMQFNDLDIWILCQTLLTLNDLFFTR